MGRPYVTVAMTGGATRTAKRARGELAENAMKTCVNLLRTVMKNDVKQLRDEITKNEENLRKTHEDTQKKEKKIEELHATMNLKEQTIKDKENLFNNSNSELNVKIELNDAKK